MRMHNPASACGGRISLRSTVMISGSPKYVNGAHVWHKNMVSARCLSAQPRAVMGVATVIERRSADVAVLGDSVVGVLAAYALAKRGKKVLLLPNLGVQLSAIPAAPLQPLRLVSADPVAAFLANEAAQYWRGLQMLAQSPLLQECSSLDWESLKQGQSSLLEAVQATLQDQSIPAVFLTAEEVAGRCGRTLSLPSGCRALWQPAAAVLRALDAQQAALVLGERVGVLHKEHLILRGWRDSGSYFQLRASTALQPDLISEFEVEQLLLTPDSWAPTNCGLFGFQADGWQVHELLELRAAAGSNLQQLPLWSCWHQPSSHAHPNSSAAPPVSPEAAGTGSQAAAAGPVPPLLAAALEAAEAGPLQLEAAGMPTAAGGLPMLPGGSRVSLLQQPGQHTAVGAPWQHRQAAGGQPLGAMLGLATGGKGRRDEAGSTTPMLTTQQQAAALGVLSTSFSAVKGLGDPLGARCYSRLMLATADGLPVVGYHPGYEQGRISIAVAAAGITGDKGAAVCSSSSYHLSPMVAHMGVQLVLGSAPTPPTQQQQQQPVSAWSDAEEPKQSRSASGLEGSTTTTTTTTTTSDGGSSAAASTSDVWSAVSTLRAGLGVQQPTTPAAAMAAADTWDALPLLQTRPQQSAVQLEQQQDEGRDAERVAKGRLI